MSIKQPDRLHKTFRSSLDTFSPYSPCRSLHRGPLSKVTPAVLSRRFVDKPRRSCLRGFHTFKSCPFELRVNRIPGSWEVKTNRRMPYRANIVDVSTRHCRTLRKTSAYGQSGIGWGIVLKKDPGLVSSQFGSSRSHSLTAAPTKRKEVQMWFTSCPVSKPKNQKKKNGLKEFWKIWTPIDL